MATLRCGLWGPRSPHALHTGLGPLQFAGEGADEGEAGGGRLSREGTPGLGAPPVG